MPTTIGSWHVDREQRTLTDQHRSASLTPRSWDVLIYLLDHRGELVPTRTLLARFWGGVYADETYVRKAISEIRRALGDDAAAPALLRTVPKRGYLLVADEPTAESDPGPAPERITLAVLPFVNMSSDSENEFFSDGLTEEIVNELTRRLNASVVARTSAFRFKGVNIDIRSIGRALDASHLLEGSVRKAANAVKVTAQLIDAATGVHLWSEGYQRELQDVFDVQREIAEVIAREVGLHLRAGRNEPPTVLETVYVSRSFVEPDEFRRLVQAISSSMKGAE